MNKRTDPADLEPPRPMVVAAKRFIRFYVRSAKVPETIDERVDQALEEWRTWVGKAFNEALAELGLVEDE